MKIAFVVIAITASAIAAETQRLPTGWSLPTEAQLASEDRSSSPHRFPKISADFNGDGKTDEALLAVSVNPRSEGLLVHLSNEKGEYRWAAGDHRFICIEHNSECIEPTENKNTVTVTLPAIDYFRFESASSFYSVGQKNTKLHTSMAKRLTVNNAYNTNLPAAVRPSAC